MAASGRPTPTTRASSPSPATFRSTTEMSGSLNPVQLIGPPRRDPETRRTLAGDPVVDFRLATSEAWKDKATGDRREQTEWHSVVIFNEALCRVAEQYLKKGANVFIERRLQTRK